MAPTQPPQNGDIPILQEQRVILLAFILICLMMICTVQLADWRSISPRLLQQCHSRLMDGDDPDSPSEPGVPNNPHGKGKGVDASETTPLLSPKSSTVVGSEASRSERTDSWPSVRTNDSGVSVSTSAGDGK